MKTGSFATLFCATVLVSCSNADFGYNEKMAGNFLSVMERVDEVDKNVKAGDYYHLNTGQKSEFERPATQTADNLIKYVQEMENDSKELRHSEKANEFHNHAMQYFADVKNLYLPEFRNYLNAGDSITRNESAQKLLKIHEKLDDEVDKTQEVQKKFFDAAGLGAKNNN